MKMAGKECPPPARCSPLQPVMNHGNLSATSTAVHPASSRCKPVSVGITGSVHVATTRQPSYIVHIKLGDMEKVLGAVKFSATDPVQ